MPNITILVYTETLEFLYGFAEIFCIKPTDLNFPLPLLVVPPAGQRETEDMIAILFLPVSGFYEVVEKLFV